MKSEGYERRTSLGRSKHLVKQHFPVVLAWFGFFGVLISCFIAQLDPLVPFCTFPLLPLMFPADKT